MDMWNSQHDYQLCLSLSLSPAFVSQDVKYANTRSSVSCCCCFLLPFLMYHRSSFNCPANKMPEKWLLLYITTSKWVKVRVWPGLFCFFVFCQILTLLVSPLWQVNHSSDSSLILSFALSLTSMQFSHQFFFRFVSYLQRIWCCIYFFVDWNAAQQRIVDWLIVMTNESEEEEVCAVCL